MSDLRSIDYVYVVDVNGQIQLARKKGEQQERSKWQSVIADKESALAEQAEEIARLRAQLGRNK